MQFGEILPCNIRDLSFTKGRQDDAVDKPAVFGRCAGLALRIGVLGQEPLGKFGNSWRLLSSELVGARINSGFDQPEQPFGFTARCIRGSGRTVLTERYFAKRRDAPGSRPVMDDIALRAAALDSHPEAFDLGVPDHRLGAIRSYP